MTTITIEKAIVHRALSALEYHTQQTRPIHNTELVIEELRAALTASATAPAWNNVPTCAGLWFCDEGDENPYRFTCHNVSIPLNPYLVGEGERWYGPIPPDGDKP